MPRTIAAVTVVVPDYDAAIAFYTEKLGFVLMEDTRLSERKRWVLVGPTDKGARLLLAKAEGAAQEAAIGNQTGGRVFLFLNTDNFERDYRAMRDKGVTFVGEPRVESYGKVVVFQDPFGNRWDLIEPA